jgi:hypothetical protein
VDGFRFVSPERRWRAAVLVLLAGVLCWRALRYSGPGRDLAVVMAVVLPACLLALVVPVLRTCLEVTADELVDRRLLTRVRVPWDQVSAFRVARPGWLWGGFCVVAECADGREVDLLSTRAYAQIPSSQHLDELQRLCWTLAGRLPDLGPQSDPGR